MMCLNVSAGDKGRDAPPAIEIFGEKGKAGSAGEKGDSGLPGLPGLDGKYLVLSNLTTLSTVFKARVSASVLFFFI